MKALHGGKATNDNLDAHKMAVLLRGGMWPQAYVYPAAMRATRDLLRRRLQLMRPRAALLPHVRHTNGQYHSPASGTRLAYKTNRVGVAERSAAPAVRNSIAVGRALIDADDQLLQDPEWAMGPLAKQPDAHTLDSRQTVPGLGKILRRVLLEEMHDLARFPRVQDFVASCRPGKCATEPAGKRSGPSGTKLGNASLKVGLLGSGGPVPPHQPCGPKGAGPLREHTRPGHGPPGAGPYTRAGRL